MIIMKMVKTIWILIKHNNDNNYNDNRNTATTINSKNKDILIKLSFNEYKP